MKLTPLQKRAERKNRHGSGLDMNLVSLIDIFTILIFFLMSSTGVELLTSSRAVQLPQSTAQQAPRETVVVTVTAQEIVVDGRRVASVADALAQDGDLIAGLKAELDQQAQRQTIRQSTAAQAKALTIMGDRQIPYRLLRKVMVTAAQADFSDVSFAVAQKGAS
jgi:biopolymer transport protein TolR